MDGSAPVSIYTTIFMVFTLVFTLGLSIALLDQRQHREIAERDAEAALRIAKEAGELLAKTRKQREEDFQTLAAVHRALNKSEQENAQLRRQLDGVMMPRMFWTLFRN